MAGSYNHCVTEDGRLRAWQGLSGMLNYRDTGDVWEAVEEMYGMIWFLADGDPNRVEFARRYYQDGINRSPGIEQEEAS